MIILIYAGKAFDEIWSLFMIFFFKSQKIRNKREHSQPDRGHLQNKPVANIVFIDAWLLNLTPRIEKEG